ncbi:unnamed protein product [Rhizophagus irregularis]|uniref:Uncharacterized protein n=1 Tax=Rhizophagus irregularis TaxID=588596 RepID=A0A916E681_9GLOM|nr:unnamed protein product [Rhizophagus irregularis]CAB5365538.1 unnamed protein product [Rhizophagus irregularis]
MRDGDSIEDVRFSNAPNVLASLESARFSDATFIMPCKSNINKLRSLNSPVARTNAVHTVHTGGNDARKADSDVAKGLYLLLSRSLKVMFTAQVNLWADIGLVNSSVGVVQEIVFEENQGPPFSPYCNLGGIRHLFRPCYSDY